MSDWKYTLQIGHLFTGQYFCDGFSRLYPASEVENNKPHLLLPSAPPTTSGLRTAVPLIGDLCEVTSVTVDDLVMMTGKIWKMNGWLGT